VSQVSNNQSATGNQALPRREPLEITVVIERPYCRKDSGWQAAAIRPIEVNGHEISAITGVTPLVLSRFTRVTIKGYLETRFGKYQVKFFECAIVEAEYRYPPVCP
jgi:hypothetical protein